MPMTDDAGMTITEAATADAESLRELRYLEQFENLIITLSGRFVNLTAKDLDREIDNALRTIGTFAAVDRSYVFQFSPDRKRFSNTHEWCSAGVEPAIERLQDAPADQYDWALRTLIEGRELYVEDVDQIPPEAEEVRRELLSQGIRSMINIPLLCGGRVLGFVGFDALSKPMAWTAKHRNLLKVVGEIIAGAIERERATAALAEQLALEKLVADISTHFINVPMRRLGDEIQQTIRRIGEFTGVDRSYVFRLSADGSTMDNTNEWCAKGIAPHIDRLQGLPVDEFGFSMALLQRGEVFHVPDVAALPPVAEREQREFQSEGIQTLVNVPIMARQTMIGFLGFDAVRARKVWSDDDIRLLKLVGEIIANALDRAAVEQRLEESLADKDVLLREIHHRVKNNMQVVNSLLYLQENAVRERVDAVALDAFQQSRARIKTMATIHDRLYRSRDFASIHFDDYLNALVPELLRSYGVDDKVSAEIAAENIELGIDAAVPCALIINELFTNSLKHAFPDDRTGSIRVAMHRTGQLGIELTVVDDGIGFPSDRSLATPATLGLRLVADLARQLDGEVELLDGEGTRIRVRFSRTD